MPQKKKKEAKKKRNTENKKDDLHAVSVHHARTAIYDEKGSGTINEK
jgi:hypothetical protein